MIAERFSAVCSMANLSFSVCNRLPQTELEGGFKRDIGCLSWKIKKRFVITPHTDWKRQLRNK